MSRQTPLSAIIHLRDFVDTITDDPTRQSASNYTEIQTDINIFEEDLFYNPSITVEPIRTHNTLETDIHALSLMRHLPEQWCPMVTIIGCVRSRHPSEPRLFTLETSVYNASKTAPVQFSVVCFFENTKRWQNVKAPLPEAFLSTAAKVAGRTADTNLPALRVLDLTYLPRPASAAATPRKMHLVRRT
ncbi:hypothetical protein DM02DRAFT_714412 [Periconia macrospinosa]|uniref:Uncharacterized protein n=1 Tax=Periconia macrospinosa TaxID=97972 RepID=A0A2V1EAQ9_9PLEO|nr:hypothetical protein DM02DRAFT_714412 [Periconia macrospinosa]